MAEQDSVLKDDGCVDAIISEVISAADKVESFGMLDRCKLASRVATIIAEMHEQVAGLDLYGRKQEPPNVVSRLNSVARIPAAHSAKEVSIRLLESVQVIRMLEQEIARRRISPDGP